jgi:hypothetical protein
MSDRSWLWAFGGEPDGRCPKCLITPVMTEYHDAVVVGMCKEKRDVALALAEYPEHVPDEATEHLCRGCPVCSFTWSERVATAEDMKRAQGLVSSDN